MSLKDQIMADVKSAMKNKEADKLSALRFLQAAIKNKEIDVRPNEITEDDVLGVIKKAVKQRKDSIEQYGQAGRDDLVQKETFELEIIQAYLPEQLSEEAVAKIVEQVIAETGASSMKDMGAVIQAVMAKTAGAADNKVVSQLVRGKLG